MNALLLIFVVGSVSAACDCNFPPSLWCSSAEVASRCKVYEQCKQYVWTTESNASAVQLELYYESLCPDCQEFITSQLFPTYGKIGHIMNITLVPYGNAEEKRVGDQWQFTCQHGELECLGNIIETCAISHLRTMEKIMPFVNCMEKSESSPMKAAVECASQQLVDVQAILSCANSSEGNQLEHAMAKKTDSLHPTHQYVPWIVLNGVHTETIEDEATKDLMKLICKTYTGPKPSPCTALDAKKPTCSRTDLS